MTDVPHLLRLVAEAAQDGDLNPSYLNWRYQIGLAKALFATILLGRHRDEHRRWLRASLQVVRVGQLPVGFSLIRDWRPDPTDATHQHARSGRTRELYLVCIDRAHRHQGLASAFVQKACAQLSRDEGMLVLTLVHNTTMARLMQQAGAHPLGAVTLGPGGHVPVQAYALGTREAIQWLARDVAPIPSGSASGRTPGVASSQTAD